MVFRYGYVDSQNFGLNGIPAFDIAILRSPNDEIAPLCSCNGHGTLYLVIVMVATFQAHVMVFIQLAKERLKFSLLHPGVTNSHVATGVWALISITSLLVVPINGDGRGS